jgi:hypothetical protein
MLPPRARLPDLLPFVEQQLYFVVHAARQTGKTTAMRAFAEELRAAGTVALCVSLAAARGIDETASAEMLWLNAIHDGGAELDEPLRPPSAAPWTGHTAGTRLRSYLMRWSAAVAPRAVVLFLDDADGVGGPALLSLLAQLRAGFMDRGPGRFPVCLALIGELDLSHYRAHDRQGAPFSAVDAFNIRADTLSIRPFTPKEVRELLDQHHRETGQPFTPEAAERVYHWGQGQAALTDLLADRVTQKITPVRTLSITAACIDRAVEDILQAEDGARLSVTDWLWRPAVAPVLQALLLGDQTLDYSGADFDQVVGIGLGQHGAHKAEIANPLYRELFIRALLGPTLAVLPEAWWPWKTAQGGLDMPVLIAAFLTWWRENAEMLERRADRGYLEALPHITFMAFLQKVVNGGGRVTREFAGARGAIDLLVEYCGERHVIELKRVRPAHDAPARVREAGVRQLCRYLDTVGERHGWLLIFDQREGRTWEERLWAEELEVDGRMLHLRGA